MFAISPDRFARLMFLSLFVLLLITSIATAQVAVPADNTISLHRIFGPWMEVLVGGLATVVTALLGWVAAAIQRKTGVEVEFLRSQTLQTAITNAAGKVVMMTGEKMKDIKFTVENEAIRKAILYVIDAAPEAVKHFGLSPADIAEKVIAKIGVVTASNPEVNPSTESK